MVDNFNTILPHLTFVSDFDRYIVHVIKRGKDDLGKTYGVNETNRLIKTFYITSEAYFKKKIPVIKDLCDHNRARAYILPQVRNNEECLRELLKIVVDNLDNPTIKPDHLIRSAYCGYHGSRDKKWILDLDSDNMTEYRCIKGFPCDQVSEKQWSAIEVLDFVRKQLVSIGKSGDDAYMIPTKSGHCIVTSPFNLERAHAECSMMRQGQQSVVTGYEKTPAKPTDSALQFFRKSNTQNINGWLIKDGMALLYFNGDVKTEEDEISHSPDGDTSERQDAHRDKPYVCSHCSDCGEWTPDRGCMFEGHCHNAANEKTVYHSILDD